MNESPSAILTSRRTFLKRIALAPAAVAAMTRIAAAEGANTAAAKLKFALIADIHQDVMPDGVERVAAFVKAMEKIKPDFVLQLGDFCWPHPRNKPFLAAWNAFHGPRYHVLGNHDMDGGYKREQTAAFYAMPGTHYTFTSGPVRGIVLDANEPGGKARGYAHYVGAKQIAWLAQQLADAGRPAIIFVHQPFDNDSGVENAVAVRAVLERAEQREPGRVLAVFSGHFHEDYLRTVAGIPYVQINSASYVWLGEPKTARETWPHAVHAKHPSLVNVAAYRDPLWAVVTLDLARGEMTIEGRRSEWVGPDPWQRGASDKVCPRDRVRPAISDRSQALVVPASDGIIHGS
jgi:3',5'-cyclic AMP phosphodiesterase CpdA